MTKCLDCGKTCDFTIQEDTEVITYGDRREVDTEDQFISDCCGAPVSFDTFIDRYATFETGDEDILREVVGWKAED